MATFKTSVIISTFNQPEWLQKVLWGYELQTESNFEIIIADDGSTEENKQLNYDFIEQSSLNIEYIWQKDNGFQKTKILNKAILKTSADYLIFTDGDCIPRNDFVETHLKLKKNNTFLSGGYFKLPESISKSILKKHIENQECFELNWLYKNGLKKTFKTNKLTAKGFKSWLLNSFTPTKATFDGMNVSGWKRAIINVNGFDERMQYGGEDRELGERLMNEGIKFKQIRYSAICLHLDHERGYVNPEMIENNMKIRALTKKHKVKRTLFGIEKESGL
jgi:glycosyltransferase involved in cell wall biosynthesis